MCWVSEEWEEAVQRKEEIYKLQGQAWAQVLFCLLAGHLGRLNYLNLSFPINTMGITILPNRLVVECLAQCLAHRKCSVKGSNELGLVPQSFCAITWQGKWSSGATFPGR